MPRELASKMKFVKAFATFFLLAVLAAAGWWVVRTPFGPGQETFVDIAPGTAITQMAEQLKSAGVVRSAVAFEAYKVLKGGVLKAGVYRFDGAVPLGEVYARLHRGDVYTKTLVIPEGYNMFDIATAVAKSGLASRADFLKAATTQTELIAAWNPHAASLEGFLFPDTYRFSPHATATDMVAMMVRRFDQVAAKIGLTGGGLPGDQVFRDVTMASLVEREVHVASERAVVAGVFENRLASGMPLQTDPTVVYASILAGTWTGTIHQSELHADSPYNTYAHAGLPPGPICNPGMASLMAALHPDRNEFLYFVAGSDGGTKFAATLAEHNANVAAYRASIGEAAPAIGTPPAAMQPALPSSRRKASSRRITVSRKRRSRRG
jgi:UPF0755 protein